MLIQKVFHVQQGLDEAKVRIGNFHSYRRVFEGVNSSTVPAEGVARFQFSTGNGFRAQVEISELPTEDPNQTLFRSTDGNMEIAGLIEYFAIRDNLTEVQVTLEYTLHSHMYSVLDAVTGSMDRFLNRQIRRLQGYLSGAETVTREHRLASSRGFSREPQLAH
jgi:uncharacterized membrane protein